MERGRRPTLAAFVRGPFCRLMARVLILLMAIEGWPLWELSQSRCLQFESSNVYRAVSCLANFIGPQPAEAAVPTAEAGPNRLINKNNPLAAQLVLDGTASSDADGDSLTYQWYGPFTATSQPVSTVSILQGKYTISLLVDDGQSSDLDSAIVEVVPCFTLTSARAKSGKVQLTWNHLLDTQRYDIYRADQTAPSAFVKIGETFSTYSTYLDSAVANETTYLYLVGALSQASLCYSGVAAVHPTAARSAPNYAPLIYSSPITHGIAGVAYNYDANAADPNGDALTYTLVTYPAGMTIDSGTGLMSWIPDSPGSYAVTIRASDGRGGLASQNFIVSVQDILFPNSRVGCILCTIPTFVTATAWIESMTFEENSAIPGLSYVGLFLSGINLSSLLEDCCLMSGGQEKTKGFHLGQ